MVTTIDSYVERDAADEAILSRDYGELTYGERKEYARAAARRRIRLMWTRRHQKKEAYRYAIRGNIRLLRRGEA